MSTKFYIAIQVADEIAASLGAPGDEGSPVLDAVKAALETIGASFVGGQIAPAPPIQPPFGAVTVQTSPVSGDLLQEKLREVWPRIQAEKALPAIGNILFRAQD